MSFFSDSDSPSNLAEYSVSELSGSIKRTVEQAFDQVRVRGEISGYRGPHSSCHAYFSLKDDRALDGAGKFRHRIFGKVAGRITFGKEAHATKCSAFGGG